MTVNDCVSITEIILILVIEENGTRKVARSLVRRMKIRIIVRPLYDRVTDVKSFDIKLRLLCFRRCRCLRCFCNFRRILLQIPVFIRAGLVIQVNADQLVPGKAENSKCR